MGDKQLPEALSKYTLQQLQLELLRRSKGDEIVAWLLEHQSLWTAVILDEIEFDCYQALAECRVLILGKLLSTASNRWSADYLYFTTKDRKSAEELCQLGVESNFWDEDEVFTYDEVSSRIMLGYSQAGYVTVANLLLMRRRK